VADGMVGDLRSSIRGFVSDMRENSFAESSVCLLTHNYSFDQASKEDGAAIDHDCLTRDKFAAVIQQVEDCPNQIAGFQIALQRLAGSDDLCCLV
jgi:hypothetical protein